MGKPGNSKKISSPVSNASVGNAGPVPTGTKVTFNSQGSPIVTPQPNNPQIVSKPGNPSPVTPQAPQPSTPVMPQPMQGTLPINQNIQGLPTGKSANPNFQFNNLDLNQMHQDQTQKDIMATLSEKMYMAPSPMKGSQYSFGQELNYALETGQPLNTNQQLVFNNLENAMRPIGVDTHLTRFAHQDFLQRQFGIQNYQGMSDAQLSNALVGQTFKLPSMASTTTNVGKMQRSNASSLTEKEIQINIGAHASTRGFAIDPSTGQNELLLSSTNTYKIIGARFPKTSTGRRKQGRWKSSYYDLVELEVEVWHD